MTMTKKYENGAKALFKKFKLETDIFDYKSHFDSSLTDNENLTELREYLKQIAFSRITKEDTKRVEQQEKAFTQQYLKDLRAKERKDLLVLKQSEEISCYENLRNYIKMVADNDYNTNLVLLGSAGWGKTYKVLEVLTRMNKKIGEDYEILTSTTTPLELYNKLYENNGKLMILDDIDLFTNRKMVNILKSALWSATGNKRVQYNTTSHKLKAPPEFLSISSFIIILNDLITTNKDVKALLSRALYYELEFNYTDKIKILYAIAREPYKKLDKNERKSIVNYINSITSEATKELNIRTLIKAYEIFRYSKVNKLDKWKQMTSALVSLDEDLETVKYCLKTFITTNERVHYFKERTGKSRRSYFYLQHKLLKSNPELKKFR